MDNQIDFDRINDIILYDVFPSLFVQELIFKQSRIDIKEFYKACTVIGYKTSNSQKELEDMPYYLFNNISVFLNEIIEAENGDGKNSPQSGHQDMMNSAKGMMSQTMSGAKNMLKH